MVRFSRKGTVKMVIFWRFSTTQALIVGVVVCVLVNVLVRFFVEVDVLAVQLDILVVRVILSHIPGMLEYLDPIGQPGLY